VLRDKAYVDGTFPLALRIIKDRKIAYIHLGYGLAKKDWDEKACRVRKSHPNSTRLNNFIAKKLAEANETALELDTQKESSSSGVIKRKIKPAADAMFFARADLFLERLKESGNYNRWRPETSRLRTFKEFVLGTDAVRHEWPAKAKAFKHDPAPGVLAGPDVPFQPIDVGLLTRFKIYLKAQRGLSDRSIANFLITIQAIFAPAINEDVLDKKYTPFGKDKIRIKLPESLKVGLTKEDVEKLETAELSHPAYAEARDVWLLSFYFAGMRAADVLKLRWSDFREGRLHYLMNKNGKAVSLKVPEKAQTVLDRYAPSKGRPDSFVFGYLKGMEHVEDKFLLKKRIASAIGQCDKLLRLRIAPAAGVEGKLTLHIARHTFATLAGDKIPVQMLQKLYRHSDIKTTLGYQANFINKDADDALDAVLGG